MRMNTGCRLLLFSLLLIAGCEKGKSKSTVSRDKAGHYDAVQRVYIKPGEVLEWDAGDGVKAPFYIFFKGKPPCEGVGSNAGKANNFVGDKDHPASCKVRDDLPKGMTFQYDISDAPLEIFDEGPGHCKGCRYDSQP
jgi:hypothetical protein